MSAPKCLFIFYNDNTSKVGPMMQHIVMRAPINGSHQWSGSLSLLHGAWLISGAYIGSTMSDIF